MNEEIKKEITTAINAHGARKDRIKSAIETGQSEFKPESVSVDNNCAFGKWLYTVTGQDATSSVYLEIKDLHAQFHKVAAEVLKLAIDGKKEEALAKMAIGSDYVNISSNLILSLGRWSRS